MTFDDAAVGANVLACEAVFFVESCDAACASMAAGDEFAGGVNRRPATSSNAEFTPPSTRKAPRQPVASKRVGTKRPQRKGAAAPPVFAQACARASRFENHWFIIDTAPKRASECPKPTSRDHEKSRCHVVLT